MAMRINLIVVVVVVVVVPRLCFMCYGKANSKQGVPFPHELDV